MDTAAVRRRLKATAALLRLEEVAERLRGRDLSTLVARVDEVMADTYTFSKTWDMERCRVPFTLPAGAYDWNVVNNDDEEWCFMLNRMDYLEDLALVALTTGEARYAEKAAALLGSWIDAHPTIKPELSTRTLDTGIRIRSWATALPALEAAGVLTDELLGRVVESIRAQIASLRERYVPKYETSNWGSIQTLGILTTLATIEDDPSADDDWKWATERAESQIAAQVYPDGIDWEQSTMYHVEVLLYSLRALHTLEAQGAPLPRGLREAAASLSRALAAQMMPGGCIDAQGDSDRTDVRGLMALCAGVLGDGALAAASGRTELEPGDLFAFGCAAEDALRAAEKSGESLPLTFDGMDSGLFVARSSWDADANLTEFSSGPLGSGHGHSDNLHVTAVYQGVPVLVDGGRYTYREDSPVRPFLKGPLAHNVPLLDGRSSCVPKGSWGYSDFGYPLKTYARHAGCAHYFEGTLVGHDPLHVLVRKLVALDCGIWVCADEAMAEGEHELVSRLHFDPEARVAAGESGACCVSCAAGELTLGSTGALELGSEQISLDYNALSDAALVQARTTFAEKGGQLWWLAPADVAVSPAQVLRGGTDPVDPALAEAVRFDVAPDEFYTVAFFHGEVYTGVKAFALEGVSFHAKAVVVHGTGEQRELTVLRA